MNDKAFFSTESQAHNGLFMPLSVWSKIEAENMYVAERPEDEENAAAEKNECSPGSQSPEGENSWWWWR